MTTFYKRITGSQIQGNAAAIAEQAGTLVINDDGTVHIHDGTTVGGNPIGSGGSGSYGNSNVAAYLAPSVTTGNIIGVNSDPNVYVETVSSGNTSVWTFGTNGVLTLPANTAVIQGAGTDSNVTVIASDGATTAEWQFDKYGNLTLPVAANINYANGQSILSGISGGGSGTLSSFGTDQGVGSTYLTGNPVLFTNDDILIRTGGTAAAGSGGSGQMYIMSAEDITIGTATDPATLTDATSGVACDAKVYILPAHSNGGSSSTVAISAGSNTLTVDSVGGLTYNGGAIGFSGNYNDLSNLPSLFSGNYSDLSGAPTNVSAFTNDAGYLTSSFSGNYNDLSNLPSLFSGNYSDLSGAPTDVGQFSNNVGYITTWSLYQDSGPTLANDLQMNGHNLASNPTGYASNGTLSNHPVNLSLNFQYNNAQINSGNGYAGSSYSNANGVPTAGGSGSGMTVNVSVNGGQVTGIVVANPGTGYQENDTITVAAGDNNASFILRNYNQYSNSWDSAWTFGIENLNGIRNGRLTLPAGCFIAEGTATAGNTAVTSMILSPATDASDDNQKLVIYPTMGGEGNHLHLTSGDLAVTSIFLGNDAQYVRTRADGAVVVGTGDNVPDDAGGTGNRWVFGTDGVLTTAGNIVPGADNLYTLGTPELRWGNVHIGPGTLYITDANLATNNTAAITVLNGVLQINGANQLQVGELKFVDNTIESTSPAVDIQIGLSDSTGNLLLNRKTQVTKSLIVGNIDGDDNNIIVNGTTYNSQIITSTYGSDYVGQLMLHRHSTSVQPILVSARSNSDDDTDADVVTGQTLFQIGALGWAGTDYKEFGGIVFSADDISESVISNTSSPGKIDFNVTPNGDVNATTAMTIHSDSSVVFNGIITLPNSQGQIGVSSNPGLDIYNNVLSYGYVKLNYNDQSIVQADSNGVTITTVNSPSTSWVFSSSNGGSITFPDASVQTTAFELQGVAPGNIWGTAYPITSGTANLDYQFFFDGTTGYPTIQSYAGAGGNPIYNTIWSYDAWLAASSSPNPTAGSSGSTPVAVNNTGGSVILSSVLQPGDYVTVRIQCLDTGRIFRATFMGSVNPNDFGITYGAITVERLV